MSLSKREQVFVVIILTFLALNSFLLVKLYEKPAVPPSRSFKFVNPSSVEPIDQANQDVSLILHYKGLGGILNDDINSSPISREDVGVFLQDARTGAWLGINEKKGFVPASLLKISVMMAVLKKVERGEIKLTDSITLVQEDADSAYGDLYKSVPGSNFTVWDLLNVMIIRSDNTAKNALRRQLSDDELYAVFTHVGIENPYTTSDATVTPRSFVRILKSLYFSTYLSPELSEKALDLASDTNEESLLSRGVPPEIQVSHKFGERINGEEVSLHDCGIVYHPKNPYFLCVMTKGVDEAVEKKLIQQISKDVFIFVDKKGKDMNPSLIKP